MNKYTSKASILVKDKYKLEYRVCDIFYEVNEDETFKYIFRPNYSVINLTSPDFFQGIPGLDLDLKKKEYIRENIIPTFISERVPSENRVDYYDLLKEVGLEVMEPLLYLIRTTKYYCGDYLYLVSYKEVNKVSFNNYVAKDNTVTYIKRILNNITLGNDIEIEKVLINDDNRYLVFNVLMNIYSRSIESKKEIQLSGINIAKAKGKYKGRKLKYLDTP